MASWKAKFPGAYLKKEDLAAGDFTGTIKSYSVDDFGTEEDKKKGLAEKKLVLHFHESPPGADVAAFTCNKTNCSIIEEVLGTDDIDRWIGKRITLFNDPKVSFGGNKIGGIRVRDKVSNDSPFAAPVPAGPRPEFTVDELRALASPHQEMAMIYNQIKSISDAAAAAIPGKLFVVRDKKLNWNTVMNKLTSDEAKDWISNTLTPAMQRVLDGLKGPAEDITEDDIPF